MKGDVLGMPGGELLTCHVDKHPLPLRGGSEVAGGMGLGISRSATQTLQCEDVMCLLGARLCRGSKTGKIPAVTGDTRQQKRQ